MKMDLAKQVLSEQGLQEIHSLLYLLIGHLIQIALKDLREADYQNPGVSDGSIHTREASTNGMAEYTANTFGGAMKGDLLAVSFSGDLLRVDLDANGDLGPGGVTSIANQLGIPLDVTSLPNNSFFAGTIWVAEFSGNSIAVLEPGE